MPQYFNVLPLEQPTKCLYQFTPNYFVGLHDQTYKTNICAAVLSLHLLFERDIFKWRIFNQGVDGMIKILLALITKFHHVPCTEISASLLKLFP